MQFSFLIKAYKTHTSNCLTWIGRGLLCISGGDGTWKFCEMSAFSYSITRFLLQEKLRKFRYFQRNCDDRVLHDKSNIQHFITNALNSFPRKRILPLFLRNYSTSIRVQYRRCYAFKELYIANGNSATFKLSVIPLSFRWNPLILSAS